ncbi:MAG TPA: HAMP domain-containing sensor histidine kinase, partial [Lamprocystis sp. (in: g-proteobacteria)]|nr:HAMP domain-containing sensor histidine kinase [Lamprocystis sp. (in: g-proteobacteria)]
VNQVLDLAKIESGHADWLTEKVDLHEVIAQAVAATGQLVQARGAQLAVDSDDDAGSSPAWVLADHDRLVQVLVNLLANAAKFVPAVDGRVAVQLTSVAGEGQRSWRVCVADNGRGIPDGEGDLIFEKFRQASSGGEKPIGTGLGLPISRQIVERFGGRIWAKSGISKGATLCFELPEFAAESPSDPLQRPH